jgi:hypothetical protein
MNGPWVAHGVSLLARWGFCIYATPQPETNLAQAAAKYRQRPAERSDRLGIPMITVSIAADLFVWSVRVCELGIPDFVCVHRNKSRRQVVLARDFATHTIFCHILPMRLETTALTSCQLQTLTVFCRTTLDQ